MNYYDGIILKPSLDELYLEHHGIKGQKWGVRNGPPYPLRSVGEIKKLAGKSRKLKESNFTVASTSEGIEKTGRLPKIGSSSITDRITGFDKIMTKESENDRLLRCNPNFTDQSHTGYNTPYNSNCGNCAIANELRIRGLDVEARGNNIGLTNSMIARCFNLKNDSNTDIILNRVPDISTKCYMNIMFGKEDKAKQELLKRGEKVKQQFSKDILKTNPEGSRGIARITTLMGGHYFSYEVKDGKVHYSNPQNPKDDLSLCFGSYQNNGKDNTSGAIRLDNASINTDNIKHMVMNYNDKVTDAKGMDWDPSEWMADSSTNKYIKSEKGRTELKNRLESIYGPIWDGSWDKFNPETKQTIVDIEERYKNKKI